MAKFKRFLAMALVLFVFASALPMQALAAEPVHTTEPSPEGLVTDVYTTTETETKEDGTTVITVTVKKETDGEIEEDGKQVTLDRDTTEITVTTQNPDGSTLTETEKSGTENKAWEEEVLPGEEFEVPGEVVVGATEYETDADGNVKLDEAGNPIPKKDENGSYEISGNVSGTPDSVVDGNTTTTTTDEREITGSVTILGEDFVIDGENSAVECPVGPEDYEGKGYFDGDYDTDNYRDGLLTGVDKDYLEENKLVDPNKPEIDGYEKGFDMLWTGYGDYTDGAAPMIAKEIVYLTDENGEIVYENGYPVVDMEKSTFLNGRNGRADGTGMIGQSIMFALQHENGKYFYAYCMDAATGVSPDFDRWYNIKNIEDAVESEENTDGYISERDAGMIRAIANAGYWGTESGQGSVESLKELLRTTYAEDTVINVRYPGSNEIAYSANLHELIDGLSEYEALACTQAAIWAYANNGDYAYNQGNYGGMVTTGSVVGILSAFKFNSSSGKPGLNEYKPAEDGPSDVRLQALYQALMNLEPIEASDGTDTNVIPSENVITEVGLVVKDKSESEEFEAVNNDNNVDNDVYDADITFTLAFVPDATNDSLLVYLIEGYNEKGEPIIATDKDGKAIVRRLAGKNTEEEDAKGIETITAVDGVYTLTGLELGENTDHKFDIQLSGTQYLENGVYIYQAEGGRKESQTLVGLANGSQTVTSTTKLSLTFEVDDKRNVVASTVLFEEDSDETDPQEVPPPVIFRLDVDTTEEIPEEPIPLAAPVVTGDTSFPWMLIAIMAMFGMALINVFCKKGKYEAI